MHFPVLLSSILLTLAAVQAIPVLLLTDPLVRSFITIDLSCKANHLDVEKTFSDMYTIARIARKITPNDIALVTLCYLYAVLICHTHLGVQVPKIFPHSGRSKRKATI